MLTYLIKIPLRNQKLRKAPSPLVLLATSVMIRVQLNNVLSVADNGNDNGNCFGNCEDNYSGNDNGNFNEGNSKFSRLWL